MSEQNCTNCGIRLIFSARARGNGLCGPCTRADAEDFAQRLDSAGHGGAAKNVRRGAAYPPRGPAVWPLVIEEAEETERDPRLIAMMRARDKQGRAKYGVPLCANDGRNTAMDALQEALDLIAYLRKLRAEGRTIPHYWQRNVSDIAVALIDEIKKEAEKPCETCGHTEGQESVPVDGFTIDAFCPTCGWMGEVAR